MKHLHRRQALQLGLGALASALASPASGRAAAASVVKPAKACIVLFMVGGPSQFETWDPKPGRETGGEFGTIRTTLPGVRISEHLPGLAERTDKLAIIRSLTSPEGNHGRARYLMHTGGYPPQGATAHPALGANIAAAAGVGALPGHVAVGGPGHGAGLLGSRWSPFVVADPRKRIGNIEAPPDVDAARLDRRLALWDSLQSDFAHERDTNLVGAHEATVRQAVAMMRAPELAAFDLDKESDALRDRYGRGKLGTSCLLARRLVERGVPFVEVQQDGWDTHNSNFDRIRGLSAELDPAMSTLLDDLDARGLLEETLVLWVGDFGRTPAINGRAGRDHYPRVANAVLAGGGIPGGQVIGSTDIDGYEVVERPIAPEDLFRTVATRMGLDPDQVRMSPQGRPIALVNGGNVIEELT